MFKVNTLHVFHNRVNISYKTAAKQRLVNYDTTMANNIIVMPDLYWAEITNDDRLHMLCPSIMKNADLKTLL